MFRIRNMIKAKKLMQRSARALGLNIIISGHRRDITIHRGFPKDMDPDFIPLYKQCQPYTMTCLERMYALYQSVIYCASASLPGSFVECGVWRGGSTMLIALTLAKLGITDRKIYLYDTFTGMTKPGVRDIRLSDKSPALAVWQAKQRKDHNEYAYASLKEVKQNMQQTGYPSANIIYVPGRVEDTVPQVMPDQIALLRLDTDWYASTYHELVHLFPILCPGGVIIIDDYGHFAGAKEAVDTYFSRVKRPILLNRIDYTARVGIKT